MPARPRVQPRASLLALAWPLALALAVVPVAPSRAQDAPAPGAGPSKSRGVRVDVERIVERAQEQAREAAQIAEEYARKFERDGLVAQLDFDDLEWPTLAFIGSEFGTVREIVKNAPYTADAISENGAVTE